MELFFKNVVESIKLLLANLPWPSSGSDSHLTQINNPFQQSHHQNEPRALIDSAQTSISRFKQSHNMGDLDRSIAFSRKAVNLCPIDHQDHLNCLSTLSRAVMTRFHETNQLEDLDEIIDLLPRVESLSNIVGSGSELVPVESAASSALTSQLHHFTFLNCIADALEIRYKCTYQLDDLVEAIHNADVALELLPEDHPHRTTYYVKLTKLAETLYEKSGSPLDLDRCMKYYESAAIHLFSPLAMRLTAAIDWSTLARKYEHHSTQHAYKTSMDLSQQALTISPTLPKQHDHLIRNKRCLKLASDAVSHAIEKERSKLAVEIFEQGRCLLWSQMRGLRTPVDQLAEVNVSLADRFRTTSKELEDLSMTGSFHADSHGAIPDHQEFDRMKASKRDLIEELGMIVGEIRKIPGFENFLNALPFRMLQDAAKEGPIIIINLSSYRSDCIIILKESDPVLIPLPTSFYEEAKEQSTRLKASFRRDTNYNSSLHDKSLRSALKWSWDKLVHCVVMKLDELGIEKQSRIWLCPTSVLTSLPLHAAGPYCNENNRLGYLLDVYVPSYTPTINALIEARANLECGNEPVEQKPEILAVGHPDTSLIMIEDEIKALQHCAASRGYNVKVELGSCKSAVVKRMIGTNWIHLACHGRLKPGRPFDSSFILGNESLSMLEIVQNQNKNAEFAFLSSCHSTAQAPNSAYDEVLHLAAAMQFCGFRSVVGTMWEMADQDGPPIVARFYTRMFSNKEFKMEHGYRRSARALRKSVLGLRQNQVPLERWTTFIHIGA